jgi:hypothetical protein
MENNKVSLGYGDRQSDFATKTAASDNIRYTVDEAERRDLIYIIENSCIACNKPFKSNEVKIVPTRYVQERDEYVRSGVVNRRYICAGCYNTMKYSTITKVRNRPYQSIAKSPIIRSILKGMLLQR